MLTTLTGVVATALFFVPGAMADFEPAEVYATFDIAGETFHASIANTTGVEEAIALWQGESDAAIPNGELKQGSVEWNLPWSWYLDPASVLFSEVTVEQCDGKPSYVESSLPSFGPRYCPWSAVLTDLRDLNGIEIPRNAPGQNGQGNDAPEPVTALPAGAILIALMARKTRIGSENRAPPRVVPNALTKTGNRPYS